ncbi:MAG: PEP/pyruvate-binding domain-containing protein [Solirubrobacteraceae bacterium]|nr:PEP/pyruvate-binding domain-containing protein [Solirubrobacteraceae bacterium]
MTAEHLLVVWLDDAPPDCGALLGGKCTSLAEMGRAGFGVPPAFGVTTVAHREFMNHGGLRERVHSVTAAIDPDDLAAVEAASAAISAEILAAPLPVAVADAIRGAYEQLCRRTGVSDVPVAVRSSGVAEDSAGASFAGQFETYLWVIGVDSVLDHVRRCWSGMFGTQVLTYRPDGGERPAHEALGMAVAVQQMVLPRAAGVMFTLEPVTGDRSKVVIEGSWGFGEAVVSGEVTPDRFRVDKVTLEVLHRDIARKEREFRFEPEGGVTLCAVSPERRDIACLEEEHIVELVSLAKRIERHRGPPQDIEWAVDQQGRAYVLQVRPETVWSRRETKSIAGGASALELIMSSFMAGDQSVGNRGPGT